MKALPKPSLRWGTPNRLGLPLRGEGNQLMGGVVYQRVGFDALWWPDGPGNTRRQRFPALHDARSQVIQWAEAAGYSVEPLPPLTPPVSPP